MDTATTQKTDTVSESTGTRRLPGSRVSCCTTEVCVLFTTVEQTRHAVRVGHDLAQALAATLTLIDFRITTYPLRSDAPGADDPVKRFVQQLRWAGTDIGARSFVCGTDHQAIPLAFRPHSIIVVGARRSWLPTRTERLRRALEWAGHFVLFVDEASHDSRTRL
jgi:hypothetical protein